MVVDPPFWTLPHLGPLGMPARSPKREKRPPHAAPFYLLRPRASAKVCELARSDSHSVYSQPVARRGSRNIFIQIYYKAFLHVTVLQL